MTHVGTSEACQAPALPVNAPPTLSAQGSDSVKMPTELKFVLQLDQGVRISVGVSSDL